MTLEQLVEELNEKFLDSVPVINYVDGKIAEYCDSMGFDVLGPHTEMQEELICQFQVGTYHRILAAMITKL